MLQLNLVKVLLLADDSNVSVRYEKFLKNERAQSTIKTVVYHWIG
jgi:hypothetical protein